MYRGVFSNTYALKSMGIWAHRRLFTTTTKLALAVLVNILYLHFQEPTVVNPV